VTTNTRNEKPQRSSVWHGREIVPQLRETISERKRLLLSVETCVDSVPGFPFFQGDVMRTHLNNHKGLVLVVGLIAIALIVAARLQPVQAERAAAGAADTASGPHYTVVETEGHNLIVTDNRADMLYFYTIDKDKEIGSELKLRGKADLTQVGKPVIKPETTKKADAEK
jgi:hypothetical protein